jgi:hypothetical protein
MYDLFFHEDCRGNHHYEFKDVEDEEDEQDAPDFHCGTFSIPLEKGDDTRIYLVEMDDYPGSCTLVTRNVSDGLLQLHSHINKCGGTARTWN